MPAKLLLPHLRLLQFHPSLSTASNSMKLELGPSLHSSRALPLFCRLFPFKSKYHGLLLAGGSQLGARMLSAHPHRDRERDRDRVREQHRRFPRSDNGGKRSRSGRGIAAVDARPKSLIEDEAELSDWVSDLRTADSFRGKLTGEEDGSSDGGYGRGRSRSSDSKRRRKDSDSDDGFGGSIRQRSRRSSFSGKSYGRDTSRAAARGLELEDDEEEGFSPPRRFRDDKSVKGSMSSTVGRKGIRGRVVDQRSSRPSQRNEGISSVKAEEESGEEEYREERRSLTDLISEEDDDESEVDDTDDDEFVKRGTALLFGAKNCETVHTVSPEKSASYLSETRYYYCFSNSSQVYTLPEK